MVQFASELPNLRSSAEDKWTQVSFRTNGLLVCSFFEILVVVPKLTRTSNGSMLYIYYIGRFYILSAKLYLFGLEENLF